MEVEELDTALFRTVTRLAKEIAGISLTEQNLASTALRLRRMARKTGHETAADLVAALQADTDGSLSQEFANAMATHKTHFFRERDHFQAMAEALMERSSRTTRPARIWSAACSYGQEPYSIAMALEQRFAGGATRFDYKVLATDLSTAALATAKKGVYRESDVQDIAPGLRAISFTKTKEGVQVAQEIRNKVVFRQLNLVRDIFQFKAAVDVIFVRNVLIYFDKPTVERVIRKFYEVLAEDGLLITGHAESLVSQERRFHYVDNTVYRKRGEGA